MNQEVQCRAVTIRNVSKWYGSEEALKETDLDIQEGEVVTLLGPSGSGKTTLLRLVAGFIEPTTGVVMLRGRDVTHTPPQKRNTAMVFQNYALFPHMSVFDNLAFGLRMRKMGAAVVREKVENALRLIQMDGYGKRLPRQLSGGQQQRIALMRAMIIEPDVLLMDEPLGALDRKLREDMQLEIKSFLDRMNITALYVTHDQEEALVLSDRIAVMSKGVIEQIGSPDQIYNKPQTPFVASFVGVSNLIEGRIERNDGEVCDVVTERGLVVRARSRASAGESVHVVLRPERLLIHRHDVPVSDVNTVHGTVKDVRYLGLSVQYVVESSEGHDLIVTQLNRDFVGNLLQTGDEVKVLFGVDDPHVLEAHDRQADPSIM